MSTRLRVTRAAASVALSLTMTGSLLALPAAVLAATPNWSADPVVSLPSKVTPGADAGYQLTIHNPGPSNISQLYLFTADASAPTPSYTFASQGSCPNTGGEFFCSLGQLRAGSAATVIVAFPTSADGTGSFSVDFVWNTTGLGSGGSDNSHGDAIEQTGTTTYSTDTTNFAGGFVVGSGTIISNGPVSNGNGTSTKVFSPTLGIPVTVEDGAGVSAACPATFTCVGETSEIHVGDGSDKYGLFKVVITIDKTAYPGLNPSHLTVIHILDDGVTYSEITASCPRNRTPTSECVSIGNGRIVEVTIWLKQNGYIKYH